MGGVTRPELTRLRNATARVARAEAALNKARADRDEYILDALHARASVTEVVAVSGLSAPRIYQIKRG